MRARCVFLPPTLALVLACLGSPTLAAEPAVKPLGAFPFRLPGLTGSPDAQPSIQLWCHGLRLVGAVLPEGARAEPAGGAAAARPLRSAYLLRDGRCDADGSISFGFLVPLKAWVFESAGRGLEERSTWLLYRFQGALASGQLKGTLVRVDIHHPGHAFQEQKVEAQATAESPAPYADENEWRGALARSYTLASSEP